MSFPPQYLLLGVGGLLVVVLIVVNFVRTSSRGDVSERLDRFAGRGEEIAAEEEAGKQRRRGASTLATRIDRVISEQGFAARIARDLAQANMKFTVAEWLSVRFMSGILGIGVGYLVAFIRGFKPLVLVIVGFFVGIIGSGFALRRAKGKRLRSFNNQLSDTITLLANSLRSGYSLLQSMELVAQEAPPPVSEEFRRVIQEVGLGLSTRDALANLLRRVPSDDLDLMVTAINIQHEVGGNLAQILDTIGHTIRERVRIKGEIRVLVAQQRISGYVVAGLPIALAVILSFINPDYMLTLFKVGLPPPFAKKGEEGWICMPICSGILMIVGFVAIQRIVNIEV
jgi:tight adherence protein B